MNQQTNRDFLVYTVYSRSTNIIHSHYKYICRYVCEVFIASSNWNLSLREGEREDKGKKSCSLWNKAPTASLTRFFFSFSPYLHCTASMYPFLPYSHLFSSLTLVSNNPLITYPLLQLAKICLYFLVYNT